MDKPLPGHHGLLPLLRERAAHPAQCDPCGGNGTLRSATGDPVVKGGGVQVVDWAGYKRIDKEEVTRGEARDKPREKIVSTKEMLEISGYSDGQR
ncbi:unnamed protein product [Choristocarpus tenellus]